MGRASAVWRRYEEMRPEELAAMVERSPVAFWPLGLLEHHGWHLPVGFDGIKADRICRRVAERTGGAILPVMWWGAEGGHGDFPWTLYQPKEAAQRIIETTLPKLARFGFRAIVLLAGHYPWRGLLRAVVPPFLEKHPGVLVLHGTEMEIGGPEVRLKGDHAARAETSFGLALLPELADMDALRPGRDPEAGWRGGDRAAAEKPGVPVCFDPADARFSQAGEDARTASAEKGESGVALLVDCLAEKVLAHLRKAKGEGG